MPSKTIQRLGVHESVSKVFPPDKLTTVLDSNIRTEIVGNPGNYPLYDGIVTFQHQSEFLSNDISWIHSISSGVDRFPIDKYDENDVILTNSTGVNDTAVAETVMAMLLSLARRLHTSVLSQTRQEWKRPDWDIPFLLKDSSICVVGLGSIGTKIASRADAFGMDVTGVNKLGRPIAHLDTVYSSENLCLAIDNCSFVVLALPLNPETRNLIGAKELRTMRDNGYLVNVSRGGVVDHDAFVEAVTTGTIAGGALDVFKTEPLPEDSLLWNLEDVIITPHIAGLYQGYYRDIEELVQDNVERFFEGRTLRNRVS